MHPGAKGHWDGAAGHRCHACTAKAVVEDAAAKTPGGPPRRGVFYGALPDAGLWHAMSDPVLSYDEDPNRVTVGASGLAYAAPTPAPEPDN